MFKKALVIIALIGLGLTANVGTASAHSSNNYHNHNYNHHYIGWRGVPLKVIRHRLRDRGFYKIRFVDRYLPVYKAKACKRGKRFKLRINRWGGIMARKRIGWCGYHHYY